MQISYKQIMTFNPCYDPDIATIKGSKQMETKTAKWQIDDGNVIEAEYDEEIFCYKIITKLNILYSKNSMVYGPQQELGKESDFTIFNRAYGTVKHAKYMPDPEFKVGDVVQCRDTIGTISQIPDERNEKYKIITGYTWEWGNPKDLKLINPKDLKLITSFEDWCKDNLPENIGLKLINSFYELEEIRPIRNILLCKFAVGLDLIHQIKVVQVIIDAVKNEITK